MECSMCGNISKALTIVEDLQAEIIWGFRDSDFALLEALVIEGNRLHQKYDHIEGGKA